jgi:hypothetical protein
MDNKTTVDQRISEQLYVVLTIIYGVGWVRKATIPVFPLQFQEVNDVSNSEAPADPLHVPPILLTVKILNLKYEAIDAKRG